MPLDPLDLERLSRVANAIRFLSMDAVQKANSGHPGAPMGLAEIGAVLWARHLRFDPDDENWLGRDRFMLSNGHACMFQYSLLHLFGCDLSIDDIKNFRQYESKTPGHPERAHTPGVEITTGPLGQGFANGVGMALAAKMAAQHFPDGEGFSPFDQWIHVIASDGCLMEGVTQEAASLAGHLKLDNLIVYYDDNHISIDGPTEITYSDDVAGRFASLGWHVQSIDGHDLNAIDNAITTAKEARKPAIVICRTHIAHGAPHAHDTSDSHGAPLGDEEIAATRKALGWDLPPFELPDDVRDFCGGVVHERREARAAWNRRFTAWNDANPDRARALDDFWNRRLPTDLFDALIAVAPDKKDATRSLGHAVLQKVAALVPGLAGGSADLAVSNKTDIKNGGAVAPGNFAGRNIHFGVREHGMGAIVNGMAAFGGWRPYGSTFLIFTDYLRPTLRLASIMHLPVVHVCTHDSFQLGEDGPTHQPIEHLDSLRLIPGILVLRPADGVETGAAWYAALQHSGPSILSLTRHKIPPVKRDAPYTIHDLLNGAQVVETHLDEEATIVATGSEVWIAQEAARLLREEHGIATRVVSMLCRERFLSRTEEERERIVPFDRPVCSIEAGATPGWAIVTGRRGLSIGLDRFGASAPDDVLREKFGFTPEQVAGRVRAWLASLDSSAGTPPSGA
ncbi:transketolase [bacterium]|nr:transketolase [bacterium]